MPSTPRRRYKDLFPGWIAIYEEWAQNELQLVCEEQLQRSKELHCVSVPRPWSRPAAHFLPGPLFSLICEHALTSDHGITRGRKERSGSPAEKAWLLLAAAVTAEQAKFLGILFLLFSKVIWASGCTFGPFPPFLFTCRGKENRHMIRATHSSCSLASTGRLEYSY